MAKPGGVFFSTQAASALWYATICRKNISAQYLKIAIH
jgi:hypothetical protein